MKGIGFDDDALSRPTIGIANTWTEAMPCNFHLRALAEHVKEGVRAAGGTPMEFNTVAVSDGVTMRSEEHTSELQSRRDLVCRLLLEKKKRGIVSTWTNTRGLDVRVTLDQ